MIDFPRSPEAFLKTGQSIQANLRRLKSEVAVPDYGWYPYESLSALPILADLIAPVYDQLVEACLASPVADLGCGDGDLAMLFAQMGVDVDAIDHRESNYNQMRGVEAMRRALDAPVAAFDIDLDSRFDLPRRNYGLALFLGTLYHLKNPYYVLEKLSALSDWCVLSTRVAQVTPAAQASIENEPVAYLLSPREVNNDSTNFWIFSPAGLLRIAERTGWIAINQKRAGCESNSDPVRAEADERMFLLLKSRTRNPELHARLLEGWYPPEQDRFRWTAKRFALEVTLPANEPAKEFALRFTAPEVVLASTGQIRLSCYIQGTLAGAICCEEAETIEFRGRFPAAASQGSTLQLDFVVENSFRSTSDLRELGVIVPLLDRPHKNTDRIPFRIS